MSLLLKWFKNIIFFLPNLINIITNFLLFKVSNVSYVTFPKVSGKIIKKGRGVMSIGKNCTITSSFTNNPVGLSTISAFYITYGAKISISDNVGISNSLFFARQAITIEGDVMIGGGCQILDTDFHSLSYEDRILKGDKNIKSAPINIKKGAFIGTSSIILKGVTIGEKSIVAAGSVVSKSIPDNEIWGGNPAKFIKKINE